MWTRVTWSRRLPSNTRSLFPNPCFFPPNSTPKPPTLAFCCPLRPPMHRGKCDKCRLPYLFHSVQWSSAESTPTAGEGAERAGNTDLPCKGNNGHARRFWLPWWFKCTVNDSNTLGGHWGCRGGEKKVSMKKQYQWFIFVEKNTYLSNLALHTGSCSAKDDCTLGAVDLKKSRFAHWANEEIQTKQEDLSIQHHCKLLPICQFFL